MGYLFLGSVKEVDGKTFIKADRLRDIVYDVDGESEVVVSEITDNSRWSTHHRCVFKLGGKYYSTHYSQGATELQHESPYEYDGEWVEVAEVVPREVTVIKYFAKEVD